jgi:hypothetical protein
MVNTRRWLGSALAILTTVALGTGGCGNSRPGNSDGTNTIYTPNAKCSKEGSISSCAVELGRQDGIVSCAKGTRTCHNGFWGQCVASTSTAQRYRVPAPKATVGDGRAAGGLRARAISATGVSCLDNPCDPYCQLFPDVPDAALTGDS